MRIAITGGTGIIGRQLLPLLFEAYPNAEYIIIGRSKFKNGNNTRLRHVSLDLLTLNKESAEALFKTKKIDYFFHLAWDTSHLGYLNSDINERWKYCSIILINKFYKYGGSKFIGIGSSLEYDSNFPPPFQEYQTPLNGSGWKYGEAKLNVFNHLVELSKNFSYLWCRVFFTFGPGQANTRFIPLLINNALKEGAQITTNINLKRDYISTFEVAKLIVMMFQTNYSGPVNISSGTGTRLKYIIDAVEAATGRKIKVSKEWHSDNFTAKEIYGSIDIIKRHYPKYAYTTRNFEIDLKKIIKQIKPA